MSLFHTHISIDYNFHMIRLFIIKILFMELAVGSKYRFWVSEKDNVYQRRYSCSHFDFCRDHNSRNIVLVTGFQNRLCFRNICFVALAAKICIC